MTEKAKKRPVDEQEADFLLAFYGKNSPTRIDRRASAISAGYTPRMALWNANRLLKKFAERSFKQCAEAVGINKPQLAPASDVDVIDVEGVDESSSAPIEVTPAITQEKDSRRLNAGDFSGDSL